MKHFIAFAALSIIPAFGGSLSQTDREFTIDQLEKSRKVFLDSIAKVSDEQWKFKPSPERWSVAECAEHITLTEPFLFGLVTGKILKGEASDANRGTRESDEKVLMAMKDRSKKATAPEPARPTGKFSSKAEVIAAFNKNRDATIDFVKNTDLDLRAHGGAGPAGKLDGVQWILLMSGHVERHTLQIQEVQAESNYPKK